MALKISDSHHQVVPAEENKEWDGSMGALGDGFTANDRRDMQRMGKKQEFRVRLSFESLAAIAVIFFYKSTYLQN